MRILTFILLLILVVLQYRLWVGEGSLAEVYSLKKAITEQGQELERLQQRNKALQAEVEDLKKGVEAIEARARNELGMIREGETFYQVIEKPKEKKQ
ncbi:MAG: cell division protein FtsB [Sedimenticola sp.]|jgi:cell division protein FtsB|nr:MAG: cell division protein FtsB [Sedimenticola sp.]